MPKKIENYLMTDKIGSGQFGEVYKGYNKDTKQEVAIKAMAMILFTGKFKELFESEIKVLRTCKNKNIIKMYDLKKTTNNYYMILEYCNEGDLKKYLESKGKLSEEEAVDFLVQILHAFKDLVKANIMHRDLKLANILKHDGVIKVADFGFCKQLGKETKTHTYLGSPLNMAPEILLSKSYDSKADIWSIGTVFYELLFGVSIYGTNDPKALINPLEHKIDIPKEGFTISKVAEDVLRRMLVKDPEQRITWKELFGHKINTYRDEKIIKDLNTSLNNSTSQSLKENMSKFYINTNKVIQNLQDYKKKEQINKFAKEAVLGKGDKSLVYKGPALQHGDSQNDQDDDLEEKKVEEDVKGAIDEENDDESIKGSLATSSIESKTKMIQRNSNCTLHERNKCAFLGSVADETSCVDLKLSNHASLVLVKQLNYKINLLQRALQKGDKLLLGLYSIEQWDTWAQTKEFENILKHISEEGEIFQGYLSSIVERFQEMGKSAIQLIPGFKEIVGMDLDESKKEKFDEIYRKVLTFYLQSILGEANSPGKSEEESRFLWQHADNLISSLQIDETFSFEDKKGRQYDFTKFYEELQQLDTEKLKQRVNQKLRI